MEIENLYKEHSFIGWTEISAKDGLMVNDSMKWETISNEKLLQWLDTLLNVLLENTTLQICGKSLWNMYCPDVKHYKYSDVTAKTYARSPCITGIPSYIFLD